MTRGARRGLVTLVMSRWEAWGSSQAGPGLERKSDPSPFEDLLNVRLVVAPLPQPKWKQASRDESGHRRDELELGGEPGFSSGLVTG